MKRQLLLQRKHIRQLSHGLFFKGLGTAMLIVLGLTGKIWAQTTFSYTGSVQPYTVPAGVTALLVDAQGATGGANGDNSSQGGAGGHVTAVIPVTPGETLSINVGGAGVSATPTAPGAGGFNGGGNGANLSTVYLGGGGGGATNLLRGATPLVVAGGGGGAGQDCPTGDDGGASATTGMQCGAQNPPAGQGATTTAGGAGGVYSIYSSGGAGTFGIGGNAGSNTGGGGGGGGYYGGGGGSYGGGGGGSNYAAPSASGVTIVNAFNTSGNGSVTLTPVSLLSFVTSTDALNMCQNSGATPIDSLLSVAYPGTSTLTWSTSVAPAHGTLLASYSTPGTGDTVVPSGLTYTPDAGYAGADTFIVTVTDGISNAFDTVYVTVTELPAITLSPIPAVCQGATSTTLSYANIIPFSFTGAMQTWAVPSGVDTITFDAWGARGGYRDGGTGTPGFGGRVQGKLPVTPGEVINIFVGGAGATGSNSGSGAAGGYNGGGISFNFGGGGGGATDIRIGGTGLTDRIIVAGAGGGGGADGPAINGGNGGGLIGADGGPNPNPGTTPAGGGTQVAGGVGANYPGYGTGSTGSLGTGGAGLGDPGSTVSAGGGGGYYGGGGGVWSGGGGGSSYTDATLISGVVHTQGFNNGDGFASVSYPYPAGTTYSITWDAAAHTAGFTDVTAILPGSPITIAIPAGVAADVYSATFTINTGMCNSAAQTIAVTVNPTPPSITGSTFLCNGGTYTLTDSITGGIWTSANTAIASVDVATGSVTAASVGTTTITYTLPTTCYTTTVVTVNAQPSAIGGNSALCFGTTATLTNDSTGGDWTSSNSLVATVGSTSGVVTTIGAGSTVVTYTLPAGCFSTTIVTVNPQPSAISGATSLCIGTTYTLTNDSTGGAWSSSNTTVATIDATTGVLTAADSGSATITYQLAGGCSSTLAVTVHPMPALTSAAIAPNTCGNGSTIFNYVPASDITVDSFTWMRAATYGISNASATDTGSISEILTDTVDVKIPVSYVYTLHLANCASTYTVIDTVIPHPRLTSTTTPAAICDSTLFSYVPSSTQDSTTFYWRRPYVSGISALGASGTGNISELLDNTSNTNKDVIYIDSLVADGCSYTQNITVQVHPNPKLTSPMSASICSGTAFDYTPTNSLTIPVVSAWTKPAVTGILPDTLTTGTNAIHETLTNTTAGTLAVYYHYTLTVSGTSCSNAETVTVNVMPAATTPSIAIKSPDSLCRNTMFQNFGAAAAPASGVTYEWTATNATIYAKGNTGQYALVNFPYSGMAVVKLSALYGSLGCPAADSFVVNVRTDSSENLLVIYTNGSLSALQNDVDTYQWGYDDALTLDSTLLPGEINQVYFPSGGLVAGRNYWVITRTGECMQKAYYNTPTGVTNINDLTDVMNVYPNPAQQNVTVAVSATVTGNIQVEVTNLLGQKVATAQAVNNQAHINVSELPAGCYVVDCFANGARIGTAKFIKN